MSDLRLGRGSDLVMAIVRGDGNPAADLARVHEVVAEGADVVEVGVGLGLEEREEIRLTVPFVAAVRDAYPDLVIGVRTGRAEVAREACAAGADLVSGLSDYVMAGESRVMIEASGAGQVAELARAGWTVLVSPAAGDLAGSLAEVAVAAWLGARVFRVPWVLQTRRALRMVAAIRGDVPPGYAVRGLALVLC